MPKKSGVAIAFIGERAANQGAFHETLNLAAISAAKKRWIEQPIPVPVVKERRRSIGMLSSSDFRPNGLADSWRRNLACGNPLFGCHLRSCPGGSVSP